MELYFPILFVVYLLTLFGLYRINHKTITTAPPVSTPDPPIGYGPNDPNNPLNNNPVFYPGKPGTGPATLPPGYVPPTTSYYLSKPPCYY